jgi:hypothetical protein
LVHRGGGGDFLLTVVHLVIAVEVLKKFLFAVAVKGQTFSKLCEIYWQKNFDGIVKKQNRLEPVSCSYVLPCSVSLPSHYFLYQLLKFL